MDSQNISKLQKIDVRELIKGKNPKLAAKIPSFFYRYLDKKLHVNEINEIVGRIGHLSGVDFIDAMANDFNVKVDVKGHENIPKDGKFIFAANHPLGGFDGMLFISQVAKIKGESRFLVNDLLMALPPLREIFIPINKHGNQRAGARLIDEAYQSAYQILIFPSGLASRKINGVVRDLDWKKHVILKSKQYDRAVVPVHISGQNSNAFYRLANFRKFFQLKWNLEMFLLSDEMFKKRNARITITFGKPIFADHFDCSKSANDWASWLRSQVYSLVGKDI